MAQNTFSVPSCETLGFCFLKMTPQYFHDFKPFLIKTYI
jgi:hypothetical protein